MDAPEKNEISDEAAVASGLWDHPADPLAPGLEALVGHTLTDADRARLHAPPSPAIAARLAEMRTSRPGRF